MSTFMRHVRPLITRMQKHNKQIAKAILTSKATYQPVTLSIDGTSFPFKITPTQQSDSDVVFAQNIHGSQSIYVVDVTNTFTFPFDFRNTHILGYGQNLNNTADTFAPIFDVWDSHDTLAESETGLGFSYDLVD